MVNLRVLILIAVSCVVAVPSTAAAPKVGAKAKPDPYTTEANLVKGLPNLYCRYVMDYTPSSKNLAAYHQALARAKNAHEAKRYILAATARILILQQKFDEAYNLSKEAMALAPNDPVLQAQMGWAEVYKENEKRGLEWFYKSMRNPNADYTSLSLCISAFYLLEETQGRLECANTMLRKYPNSFYGLHEKAVILVSLNRAKEAEPIAKQTLEIYGDTREGWYAMCMVDRAFERWKDVVKDSDKLLACGFSPVSKKCRLVLLFRAEAYEKLKDYKGAVNAWTDAIAKTPETRQYYVSRAHCYKLLGDKKHEAEDLLTIKKLDAGM